MAQHDYVIDNQSAPAARADINNALAAIRTVNSGATAPASTIADMLWYETDTFTLWKRNAGNTAWVSLGVFDETNSRFNPNQTIATQPEAEAGTNNTRVMTPLRVAQAIDALTSTVDYQVFTASGTWTKPAGISADAIVVIEAWGAGGGGGSGSGSTSSSAGGGGGGGYMYRTILASALAATETVTVGSGGAPGVAGGASSLGTVITARGGALGVGSNASTGGTGGRGGRVSTNVLLFSPYHDGGAGGTDGAVGEPGVLGAGGGGSASTSGGSGTQIAGGASAGAGAGGYGGRNVTAQAGFAPGGGGGGSCGSTPLPAAGARGEVRVWTIG